MQTEFEFTLPRGFLDESGQLQRNGRIRLATALDEIEVLQDPRVQANEAFVPILLLSRVIVQLGSLPMVSPGIIGNLFAADVAYLEDLYLRLNAAEHVVVNTECPHCRRQFSVQVAPLG